MQNRSNNATQADLDNVDKAHQCYRECMKSCAVLLKAHGFDYIGRDDLLHLADALSDTLHGALKAEISNLRDEGFDPSIAGDGDRQFIDDMYALIKGREKLSAPDTIIPFPNDVAIPRVSALIREDKERRVAFSSGSSAQMVEFQS